MSRENGATKLKFLEPSAVLLTYLCCLQQASAKIVKQNSLDELGWRAACMICYTRRCGLKQERLFLLSLRSILPCVKFSYWWSFWNFKALDTLFNLLWESSTHPFALCQILQLMKVLVNMTVSLPTRIILGFEYRFFHRSCVFVPCTNNNIIWAQGTF